MTDRVSVNRLLKVRSAAFVICATGLSACVASSDPTVSFTASDTPQTLDTPSIAVLASSETATLAESAPATDPGKPIVYSGIGVPVQAPRTPVGTTETANSGESNALSIVSDAAQPATAGAVIEASTSDANQATQAQKIATVSQNAQNGSETATADIALASSAVAPDNQLQPVSTNEAKKKSFLERLFGGNNSASSKTAPSTASTKLKKTKRQPQPRTRRGEDTVRIASAHTRTKSKSSIRKATVLSRVQAGNSATPLPGVKSNAELFGISPGTAQDGSGNTTQLAAVGSFGRLSPNGLRVQHSKVQVSCLKPEVLQLLKIVERRYGSKPIITSGYRSPKRNRRAGGARNSQHIFCKAVDIQVEGVSKWQLAKYLRTIPGRGGVGTYCRTKSVHIDVGSKRDWHHPCRRSKVKKRKKKA